jgi:hypothetical protein
MFCVRQSARLTHSYHSLRSKAWDAQFPIAKLHAALIPCSSLPLQWWRRYWRHSACTTSSPSPLLCAYKRWQSAWLATIRHSAPRLCIFSESGYARVCDRTVGRSCGFSAAGLFPIWCQSPRSTGAELGRGPRTTPGMGRFIAARATRSFHRPHERSEGGVTFDTRCHLDSSRSMRSLAMGSRLFRSF